jgi:acyl-CoA dehydrogenase
MSDSIIEDSIFRFFGKALDKKTCIEAERTGQLPEQWAPAVESGFSKLLSPESAGGVGLDWSSAFPLFWGIGYYRVPLPLAETVVASFVADTAGRPIETERPVALIDEVQASNLAIVDDGAKVRAKGTVARVHWARVSDSILIGLPNGRIGVWRLQSPNVRILERTDVTKLSSDTVVFEDALADAVFENPFPQIELPLRHFAAASRAAMIVGAAEFALQESVQYALDRVQFGRAIGKNQALQQQLAQMAGQIAVARHAATFAFQFLPSAELPKVGGDMAAVGCAKVLAGEAADIATNVAHQVHGALGFTYEHILNFATRRLWAWREDYGTASWWARRIGSQVVHAGADAFWPGMTNPERNQPLSAA